MNSLITLGTSAAYGYSLLVTLAPNLVPADMRELYFEAVGVIITLILLGLQAAPFGVLRDGAEVELPVEDVAVGDEVVVRPGEKIPVDAVCCPAPRRWTSQW